jgi:low affinity Fe/Cu permease
VANSEYWSSKVATKTANNSGRPWAFGIAGLFVAGWLLRATFPFFRYLAVGMNTISSIVTFLMVIPHSECPK